MSDNTELSTTQAEPTAMSLMQLALEKGADVSYLERLMDLAERHEKAAAARQFAVALAEFQRRMPAIVKANAVLNKSGVEMYRFANLDDIMAIAQPILSECGIALRFDTKTEGRLMTTTCFVRVGIHVEPTSFTVGLPEIPNANDAQKAGGALAYGQRYALKAALNIRVTGEDNDAVQPPEPITQEQLYALNDLIADCKNAGKPVVMPKFYETFGIEKLNELKSTDFREAESMLRDKLALATKGR